MSHQYRPNSKMPFKWRITSRLKVVCFICLLDGVQGQIQDFLIGGKFYNGGFDLIILPDDLLLYPDFFENSP